MVAWNHAALLLKDCRRLKPLLQCHTHKKNHLPLLYLPILAYVRTIFYLFQSLAQFLSWCIIHASPEITLKLTKMHPLSTFQLPASSASLNYDSFPNRCCQSSHSNVGSTSNSLNCSSNTTVFSPSCHEDSFVEVSPIIPPASAHITSTPKTCGTSRPLVTDDLFNSASSRVSRQSSPCQSY